MNKVSAGIIANGQVDQKSIDQRFLPKIAGVNIWTNKPWHLNQMVTYFEKVMLI